jgi:hypothetical protein
MERYSVTRFKSPQVALKELERFFRNGPASAKSNKAVLESGRPLKRFGGMLPRELIVNWLFAAVGNYIAGAERFQFTSDPRGGDGLIYDVVSQTALWTEHVMVRRASPNESRDTQTRIIEEVTHKIQKGGTSYASGKTLLVFLYSAADGDQWWPDKAAAALPTPLHFDAVWVVGFQPSVGEDRIYALTRLDLRRGHAPVWWVQIEADFSAWTVHERPPSAVRVTAA